jgi:type VII secretion-associated serine protease mycosin
MTIRWTLRIAAAALAVAAGPLVVPGTAAAVPPTSPDCKPPQQHQRITDVPWHVRRYTPERIWPLSTGAGVKVAVIDSGVDGAHPQLAGRVANGQDFLDTQPNARFDCVGHGTGVASIIAATGAPGIGFTGLAPGVEIVPLRVSEQIVVDDGQSRGNAVSPAGLAQAIDVAVASGAKVINMSIYFFAGSDVIRAAIERARRNDVVIIAAVGNAHKNEGGPDAVTYPAAYDGVVGVGSIDENGARVAESQVGPFVDLVAPGANITLAANRSGDHWIGSGTSFAAPHVAAAAALVRSRWPNLTAEQVVDRLTATASPARGGPRSDEYGYGEVDPYRAVNDRYTGGSPQPAEGLAWSGQDAAAVREQARRERAWRLAAAAVGVAVGLSVVVLAAVWLVPRGRRRRWLPGNAAPATRPDPAEETATYAWSLGTPPTFAHPDRAEDEEIVRQVRARRAARGRPAPPR